MAVVAGVTKVASLAGVAGCGECIQSVRRGLLVVPVGWLLRWLKYLAPYNTLSLVRCIPNYANLHFHLS